MKRNRLLPLVAVFVALAAAGWAAYAMLAGGESGEYAHEAAAGPLTAERLAELATGEMTGFQAADTRRPVAQDVPLEGPEGTTTLADLRGQVLLVNLWAEWCAPCIEELPTLDRLEAALGGEDFRVLPISLDRAPVAEAQAVLEEYGAARLTTLADRNMALMAELGVTGLPSTILIDRKGRELGRLIGPAEWDSPEAQRLVSAAIAAGE